MNCDKVRKLLSLYVDRRLRFRERHLMERHLDECESCRAELFDFRKSIAALRQLQYEDPGEAFNDKVMTEFRDRSPLIRRATNLRWRLTGALACVSILFIVGALYYVANMKSFVSRQDIYLIGRETLIPGSTASLRVVVANRGADNPIEGASVRLALLARGHASIQLLSGTTNVAGTLDGSFRVPAGISGDCDLVATATSRAGKDDITFPVRLQRLAKVFLTTDKPVYQPGQVIHLRALALLRPSLKPASGDKIRLVIEDPKQNKVFDETLSASRWGIASSDFQLGDELNLGRYTVRATLGDVETTRSVTVKRYVLPKFKVTLDTDRTYYLPARPIRGTVNTRYFFGKPVAGARVQIDMSAMNVKLDKFASITGHTDANGLFTFTARAPKLLAGQPVDRGNGLVQITARVVDTAGHGEEVTRSVPVAAKPVRIAVIPESGWLVPNLENLVYVVTSYPDGQPAPAEVSLRSEGRNLRAHSDRLGVSVFSVTPTGKSESMNVSARAPGGESASETFKFDLQGPDFSEYIPHYYRGDQDQPTIADPASLASILIRTDKAVYNVGDTARIAVFSTKKTGSVYVDAVLDGQTILTQTVHLRRGHAEVPLDLSGSYSGTVTFSAYVLTPLGVPVRDTATVLVRPANGLKVAVTPDRPVYRPGDKARIDFAVTGRDGRPVAAAIGVNIVDESVFSVEEQMPGLAALYFALQRDILKPRYQTKFAVDDGRLYIQMYDNPLPTMRRVQQAMLERQPQAQGALPGWTDPDSLLASGREGEVQRAAKVLFASAQGAADPSVNAVTEQEKDERIRTVQSHFGNGAIGWAIFYVLTMGIVAIIAWVRQSRATLVSAALSLAALAMTIIIALIGTPDNIQGGSALAVLSLPVLWVTTVVLAARMNAPNPSFTITFIDVIVIFAVIGIVAAIIFPVFARAREAARKAVMLSNLKQCAAALKWFSDDYSAEKVAHKGVQPLRVRQFFPETLYSNPAVITDESGRGSVELPVADSITTWRISALASSMNGEIGSIDAPMRVFQDFFVDLDLPVGVTQGDRISVPVAIYNYLPRAQTVTLALRSEPWFALSGQSTRSAKLGPNEVSVVYFPITARALGSHSLTVEARSGGLGDAIRREITVYPNGQEQADVANGVASDGMRANVRIPGIAIPGASKLLVKLYPGVFSQMVEGLDGLLQAPYGCFEQTSSITYPNVLILKYLQATRKDKPEVSMKAEQYISLGYQRLLTFEVPGGGFDWFGEAPANTVLTAYGVMELSDMATVATVDKGLIQRARRLLEARQKKDGSWSESVETHTWTSLGSALPTTAYVVWSLSEAGFDRSDAVQRGCDYLVSHARNSRNTYVLALTANALVAAGRNEAAGVLGSLADAAQIHGDRATWPYNSGTLTYGEGSVAGTEVTALAAHAFLKSHTHPELARKALTELIATKDSLGSWETTQATILTLKALFAGATESLGADGDIDVIVNGKHAQKLRFRGDSDVIRVIDATPLSHTGGNTIEMRVSGEARPAYSVVAKYYMPWSAVPAPRRGRMSIDVRYGSLQVAKDGLVDASATIRANGSPVKMAIVDLGLAPGFGVVTEDLDSLKSKGLIDRFEPTPRQIILYLHNVRPGHPISLHYHLRALYPVRATVPASRAYDYYNPTTTRSTSKPVVVEVI